MSEEKLLALPNMDDEVQLAIAKIYYEVGISATLSDNVLYGYIVLKRFHQVLVHGIHPYAGVCFAGYGALIATVLGDIENGIRFADLALKIVERPETSIARHKVHAIYTALISMWCLPVEKCKDFAENAYRLSREAGDQIYMGLSLMYRDFMSFLTSDNMSELKERVAKRVKITEQGGQRPMILFHKLVLQMIDDYTRERSEESFMKGAYFDRDEVVPEWEAAKNHTGLAHYYFVLIRNNYQLGNYEKSKECLEAFKVHWKEVRNMMVAQLTLYFGCLNTIALYPRMMPGGKRKAMRYVKSTLKKLSRWARLEPSKHQPHIDLIQAELARVKGDHSKAPVLYMKAAQGFIRLPSIHMHAVCLLRAGLYYLERELPMEAGVFMSEAVRLFKESGLVMFARFYGETYRDIITVDDRGTLHGEQTAAGQSLDVTTIMKSAQALSGEIVLAKLMKTIMTISLESAGAQKGFLILSNQGGLVVETSIRLDGEAGLGNRDGSAVEDRDDLSVSVVNFVARTMNPVVLGHACVAGEFASEPYIAKNAVKSLLAAPMVVSGKLKGIIYLENNLSTHVFSPERIRVLDILASQAAISIENARLFDSVMKRSEERRVGKECRRWCRSRWSPYH
jgi:GAF domain-containing protein